MNIALIIARAGSVRIKNKNIKNFFGKPIIFYPIQILKKSKIFAKIYVSTESKNISKISKKFNVLVPFLRPKKLADNKTSTLKVVKHFIRKMNIPSNDNICCVYPATPLLTKKILNQGMKKFLLNKDSFLVPIQKAKNDDKKIFSLNKKNEIIKKANTNIFFKDTGQFYFGTAKSFLKFRSILFSGKTKTMLLKKHAALDVNTPDDWKLLKKMFNQKLYD